VASSFLQEMNNSRQRIGKKINFLEYEFDLHFIEFINQVINLIPQLMRHFNIDDWLGSKVIVLIYPCLLFITSIE
jgi:hypothetical protein